MPVTDCISCDIIAGRRIEPGGVIFENDTWHVGTAIQDPLVWRGFLIVKLKRHCEHLADLDPQEAADLGPVLLYASRAVMDVLQPAKVYVCSFGEGVKHIHFWILPRPQGMHPGMHSVIFQLDMRSLLSRVLRVKRWLVPNEEAEEIAGQLRMYISRSISGGW